MEALPMPVAARGRDPISPGDDAPLWRLQARRAAYLLLVVELGVEVWPDPLPPSQPPKPMQRVVWFVLGVVFVLALLGLRYPLPMLPLLLF
jgi:hypothetical protein